MLRHYDKINLLKPAIIKENNYRYYSYAQIEIISKIKLLRACDFTLEEIGQIFANNNNNFLMEQIENKIIELYAKATENQSAISLLKSLATSPQSSASFQYGISVFERAKSNILVSNNMLDLEQIEEEFDKLFAFLSAKHIKTNGCTILQSQRQKNDEIKYQIGIPITKTFKSEQYSTISIPKENCISTIHYGDYYNIGYAYSALIKYAEINNYTIECDFTERYFIDASQTASPEQYVTEISVCIKNSP